LENKNISMAVIKRMPRYYRYLGDLLDNDILKISSKDLAQKMGITASQIRQDFNNFGSFGQQGYGYDVRLLYHEIKRIIGIDKVYSIIIIGAGNIGQALANYQNFKRRGFNIIAMFDKNPKLIGELIGKLEVLDIETLPKFLEDNSVDIAVLSIPKLEAEKVSETIISGGVKGIWNFSPVDIKAPEGVIVESVPLTDSLMTLSYRLSEESILERINLHK